MMPIKNQYLIPSSEFWDKLSNIYPIKEDWHITESQIQKISRSKLGLEFVNTQYSNRIDEPYTAIFVFKVINRKKLLWAKLKYGI